MNFINKYLNQNKSGVFILFIIMMGAICLTVGISYSALNQVVLGTETNIITAGTIALELQDESAAIVMNRAIPQEDEEALLNNDVYSFKIKNTGTIPVNYELYFNDVCIINKVFNINSINVTTNKCIPFSTVNVAVKKNSGEYVIKSIDGNKLVLDEGLLEPNATSDTYSIKIWLKKTTPDEYQGQNSSGNPINVIYAAKLGVSGSQILPSVIETCYTYTTDATSATITDYKCYSGNPFNLPVITDIVIPETLGGKPVVALADSTFLNQCGKYISYFREVTSIQFPNTLNYIGKDVFYKALNNVAVTIPASVTTIESNAFGGSTAMPSACPGDGSFVTITSLTFEEGSNLTTIGWEAFFDISLTGTITIPASVTSIAWNAFAANTGLTEVANKTGRAFDWNAILKYNIFVPPPITPFEYGEVIVSESQTVNITADVYKFAYTGNIQSFKVLKTGNYKLEIWGAQGGTYQTSLGGYGGYSVGTVNLTAGTTVYIVVGGQGNCTYAGSSQGGYNGGGAARSRANYAMCSGGGATHIATTNRGLLSTYNSYRGDLLIVAGGGGGSGTGSGRNNSGGSGGGIVGAIAVNSCGDCGARSGGSQTAGGYGRYGTGTFGWGAGSVGSDSCGGGGGFFGGGGDTYEWAASGGSGYIANASLSNKSMYCYNCTTSAVASTLTYTTTNYSADPVTNYAKSGHGAAILTFIEN